MAKFKLVTGDTRESNDVIYDLIKVMRSYGLKVYDLGHGTDMYIFAISKKKLAKSDLREIMMEE